MRVVTAERSIVRRCFTPALWAAAALVYAAIALHASSLWPKTSDQTGYFLAGVEAASGDWRLHGWRLTAPDFWTSDIALTAVLSGIWRCVGRPAASPLLLMLQPAILWTAVVASALWLALRRLPQGRARFGGGLLLAALLAVPLMRSETAYFITLSAIHIGTILYAIWAFHCIDVFMARPSGKRLAAIGGLLFLGVLGDPLMQVVGVAPALLWSWLGAGSQKSRTRVAVVTVTAAVLAPAILALNAETGGFMADRLAPRFADWNDIAANIGVTAHCVLLAFGADPFGRVVTNVAPELTRLLLLAGCVWWVCVGRLRVEPIGRGAASVVSGRTDESEAAGPFLPLLLLASALDLLSLVFSDRLAVEQRSIAAVRYLFPLWLNMSVVAALLCARARLPVLLAALAFVATAASDIGALSRRSTGVLSSEDNALLATLLRREPPLGVGTWWSSLNLEVASLGRVVVLPGIRDPEGRIQPFQHIHRTFSFDALRGEAFFVLVPLPAETYDEADVVRSFGQPETRYRIGRFIVLHYPAR
ncbi:hypothetical protein J2D73_17770 [Acetobacter sacchari]|uniref:Glycosyltransferase RgtA/B/C/D-like domain-containing protein n=1 Tax=Acetobacter sacchari TaxID=2661687 RepID=A0ABS3M0D2_9PROT|nr:hypothetical protein [Acetobacter sacchari]MBO1361633.1 hypothetical protein [Acetobacter sacchari]